MRTSIQGVGQDHLVGPSPSVAGLLPAVQTVYSLNSRSLPEADNRTFESWTQCHWIVLLPYILKNERKLQQQKKKLLQWSRLSGTFKVISKGDIWSSSQTVKPWPISWTCLSRRDVSPGGSAMYRNLHATWPNNLEKSFLMQMPYQDFTSQRKPLREASIIWA